MEEKHELCIDDEAMETAKEPRPHYKPSPKCMMNLSRLKLDEEEEGQLTLPEGFDPTISAKDSKNDSIPDILNKENTEGTEVFLVVYNLSSMNLCLSKLGIAVYHSTVRIFSVELGYGFHEMGTSGVFEVSMGSHQGRARSTGISPSALGFQVIPMGRCMKKFSEIDEIIEELKIEYIGCQYDLIKHNCNHFTDELCFKLLGKHIPNYVNRIANMAKFIRCLIPKKIFKIQILKMPKTHRKTDSLGIHSKRLQKKQKVAASGLVTPEIMTPNCEFFEYDTDAQKEVEDYKSVRKENLGGFGSTDSSVVMMESG